VVTAISEVAGNIWRHAGRGRIELSAADKAGRVGIAITATDRGEGIADVTAALSDGWSSGGGMGLGLPGARRLMDEFEISSGPGRGTTVTMARWRLQVAGRLQLDWSAAPSPAPPEGRALVCHFPGGALVAVIAVFSVQPRAEATLDQTRATLERHAGESPLTLVERCGALRGTCGSGIGIASLSAFDSRMTWLALGTVEGALVRRRGRTDAPRPWGPARARSPTARADTVAQNPGDTVVFCAGAAPAPDLEAAARGATPERAADGLHARLRRPGLVLVARRA
jgi:hypothetical protein